MTARFPFDDDSLDYIFSEHSIEHVDYESGQNMSHECFRVLKPSGRVRIATPDLEVLLALYRHEKTADQNHYLEWAGARFLPEISGCKDVFVINSFFRSWGHQFLYDKETLHYTLSQAGFRDLRTYRAGESDNPALEGLEAHGRELGSEEINQFETLAIVLLCYKKPRKQQGQRGRDLARCVAI